MSVYPLSQLDYFTNNNKLSFMLYASVCCELQRGLEVMALRSSMNSYHCTSLDKSDHNHV